MSTRASGIGGTAQVQREPNSPGKACGSHSPSNSRRYRKEKVKERGMDKPDKEAQRRSEMQEEP